MLVAPEGRSAKVSDAIVLLANGDWVKTSKSQGEGQFQGHRVRLKKVPHNAGGIHLPWHLVGVHIWAGLDAEEEVLFKQENVKAKGMLCGTVLTEWRAEWLMSKANQ